MPIFNYEDMLVNVVNMLIFSDCVGKYVPINEGK